MRKSVKLIVISVIMIITSVLSIVLSCLYCKSIKELENLNLKLDSETSRNAELEETVYQLKLRAIDGSYKLYFGEWKVEKILCENERFGADEDAQDLMGSTFYYSVDEVKKDGVIIGNNPSYKCYIIPKNEYKYLANMATPEELGISGDFTVYVHILADEIVTTGSSFYIKDDNTLILYENNAFYEMKRISYISDNVESNYVQQ